MDQQETFNFISAPLLTNKNPSNLSRFLVSRTGDSMPHRSYWRSNIFIISTLFIEILNQKIYLSTSKDT